jgi:F0F1-type ATP synthase delta subunit
VAHSTHAIEDRELKIPVQVAGPIEIGHLLNEIEEIDEQLRQLEIRHGGDAIKMPQTSRLMDQIVELNEINLLHANHREALTKFLTETRQHAPQLHMSFSADPSPAFVEKLMAWLRGNIHPEVLLTIGLQPNIGAGCTVRSSNKTFDFSLRQDFAGKRDMLVEQLQAKQEPAT